MTVRYTQHRGHPAPTYTCQRRGIATAQRICQAIPGAGVDEAVAQVLLDAVTPAALEVALEVFEELRARQADVDRLRHAQVERARAEAELAQRQFLLVRPEHRLVADTLERQWNEALARLAAVEEEYRRTTPAGGTAMSDAARTRIHALAQDLPRVWQDPRTPMRERKRLLRLMIDDVTLVGERTIGIAIRWRGGATTTLERPRPLGAPELRRTPAATVEIVRALATEHTDAQIAALLNARALRSGVGHPFRRQRVRFVRLAYGIPSLAEHLRAAGWLTAPEIATRLRVHEATAKRFAREGVLRAIRADDKDRLLFAPPTGPLPRSHPGKRFRDRRRYAACVPQTSKGGQYEA
jgi:hypothetical protein